MSTVPMDEAQARLREIVAALSPEEVLTLLEDGQPVATVRKLSTAPWPCRAGSARHRPHRMAPDFDATPTDFDEFLR